MKNGGEWEDMSDNEREGRWMTRKNGSHHEQDEDLHRVVMQRRTELT